MQEAVNRRLEQLKFEAKGEARIRLVNAAMPPGRPISDNRMKYLAMTPVGVLGTVLGLIVLLEIRSGRVADPDVLSSRVSTRSSRSPRCPTSGPATTPTTTRPSSGWPGSSRAWTTSGWRSARGACPARGGA